MTTKKSTTQKSHISLQRAAELAQGIRDLRDKFDLLFARVHDHIEGHTEWYESNNDVIKALQDRIAFLTKQSSDAFCKADLAGRAVVDTREEMDRRSITTAEKFDLFNNRLAELNNEVLALIQKEGTTTKAIGRAEAMGKMLHESLHNHEKRLRELASEWVKNKAATGYVTNPAVKPALYILIHGNPVDGMEYYGPFDDPSDASDYGDKLQGDWWVKELVKGG
jgi:hypothetical protein